MGINGATRARNELGIPQIANIHSLYWPAVDFFVWEIKAVLLKKGSQFDFIDLKDLWGVYPSLVLISTSVMLMGVKKITHFPM